MDTEKLSKAYLTAKRYIIHKGYSREVDWQNEIDFNKLTYKEFIEEYIWVVLSSGLSNKVVSIIYPKIIALLEENSEIIYSRKIELKAKALRIFNHPKKIDAIFDTIFFINSVGFKHVKKKISLHRTNYLKTFAFIGETTCYHLAKNIGLNYSKPDRHLIRISKSAGFNSPDELCMTISKNIEEKVQVVDLVLWIYATIDNNYEKKISKLNSVL